MIRIIIAAMCLSGCISDGYVIRDLSIDAEPGRVGLTFRFDNIHLPDRGDDCLDLCVID